MKKRFLLLLMLCLLCCYLYSFSYAECNHQWSLFTIRGYNERVHVVVNKCSLCGTKSETKEDHKYYSKQDSCYRCGYSKTYGYGPKPTATPVSTPKPTAVPTPVKTATPAPVIVITTTVSTTPPPRGYFYVPTTPTPVPYSPTYEGYIAVPLYLPETESVFPPIKETIITYVQETSTTPPTTVFYINCYHESTMWYVSLQPTCESEGIEIKVCTLCDETLDTRSIAKLKHNIVNGYCTYCGKQQDYNRFINVANIMLENKPIIVKGTYTAAQWDQMENDLKQCVAEAGKGTRAGVVAAARYLAGIDYRVPYSRHSNIQDPSLARRHWSRVGLNRQWGTNSWGLDCTGYVSWCFAQAGVKGPGIKVNEEHWIGNYYTKVRPGDVWYDCGLRTSKVTGETSYTQNHVAIVIAVEENGMWIAESSPKSNGIHAFFLSNDYFKGLEMPNFSAGRSASFFSPLAGSVPDGNLTNSFR